MKEYTNKPNNLTKKIKVGTTGNYYYSWRHYESKGVFNANLKEFATFDHIRDLHQYMDKHSPSKLENINLHRETFNALRETQYNDQYGFEQVEKYREQNENKFYNLYDKYEQKFYDKHFNLYQEDIQIYKQAFYVVLDRYLRRYMGDNKNEK